MVMICSSRQLDVTAFPSLTESNEDAENSGGGAKILGKDTQLLVVPSTPTTNQEVSESHERPQQNVSSDNVLDIE